MKQFFSVHKYMLNEMQRGEYSAIYVSFWLREKATPLYTLEKSGFVVKIEGR